MRPRGKAVAAWRILLTSLLWAAALAKDAPDMSVSKFDHPPLNLKYFEDSDVVVFQDIKEANVYRSQDAGVSWSRVDGVPEGKTLFLVMHPFEPLTAFVLTASGTHYKSDDRGASWTEFKTDSLPSRFQPEVLGFHAGDPKRIIFNGMDCDGMFCDEQALYTIDGFKTVKLLRSFTNGCWWAQSARAFTTGDADLDKSRILCIVSDPLAFFSRDHRLFISDSFFAVFKDEIQQFEPNADMNKGVTGIINLAVVNRYLLVATSSPLSDEMALYVTDDTLKWHRAMFPDDSGHDHSHRINQEAYTILEGTNYSIQVDVMTAQPSNPMGVLFTSNSNGTYFTENIPYTNRNAKGHVDFEKISGIQGVFLVNVVENGVDVQRKGSSSDKVILSQITFDDGRTFQEVKAGEERLHLHSVTELDNVGRVFSSPAPGLVMANGNTGKSLGKFVDANLYVSDDAGLNWSKALDGPHKYEFGDSGSVLVAVKDSAKEDVKEISYSLDHGENWSQVSLPDGLSIKPDLLTTTQDSTSLKFILLGEKEGTYHMIAINFDGLNERTCGDEDMEEWHARLDKDGNPTCIMGHKQAYRRRKKSADCFVKNEFKDPLPKTEDCECSDMDFECDYNFQRDPEDKTKCKQVGPIPAPDDVCKKNPEGLFKGSNGWRLIAGNTCKRTSGEQKDDKTDRKCSDAVSSPAPPPPTNDKVTSKQFVFESELKDFEKIYLERSGASASTDETVIVRPVEFQTDGRMKVENRVWISHDHGKEWKRILKGEKIDGIHPHLYFKDVVFFTTKDNKVIYTTDRGGSFHKFDAPTKHGRGEAPLSFHPDKKDWLIWIGEKCEQVGSSKSCQREASLSTDRGDNWKTIQRFADKCEFTGNSAYNFRHLKQIVCLVRKEEKNEGPKTVVSSDDFFDEDKVMHEEEVINFATMSEFIVLAAKDETGDLQAVASLDGKHFDKAHFPHNFRQGHENQYTLLDSSTHAINLFVRTGGGPDRQYGSIIKSNSNGTSYVLSASNVNCNEETYVDFEKVSGLEGITLINIVINTEEQGKKIIQTKISHNDGSEWGYLPPPAKAVDGTPYQCRSSKGDSSCALHLHHYTERDDSRRTFAADTVVGLLFGVGNVGPNLGDIKDADTFMSTDGGVTWKNVKKGNWTWQYGDQGTLIVLVQRATSTNPVKTRLVSYSVDEGETWKDHEFADSDVKVLDITTLKSGTSRNFLLWCQSDQDKMFSVNLDFTGLADRACKFNKDSEAESDYFLWSPKHPLQNDDCLFGHVARYLRKKTDHKCYNEQSLQRLYEHTNCACSRRDYECAFNYELDNHGQCNLVAGLDPLSGQQWCAKNPNATSWFEPTGYRKVPLSTCQGGNELDKTSTEHPCSGHEEEFEKKHRTSAVVIFFAVVIPFTLAGAAGWYVYRNWDGKFGQIRLGEQSATFDSDRPWIKYPVIAVSAVAALVATLPFIASRLWRSAMGTYDRVRMERDGRWFSDGPRRFTTRDSFARGRSDYDMVDDEGELLGDDSDEEA